MSSSTQQVHHIGTFGIQVLHIEDSQVLPIPLEEDTRLFNASIPGWVGSSGFDLSKTGIIYEHCLRLDSVLYFVVYQVVHSKDPGKEHVIGNWVEARHVGRYLISEWKVAPKSQARATSASIQEATHDTFSWSQHDAVIQELRNKACEAAGDVKRSHPNVAGDEWLWLLSGRLLKLVEDTYKEDHEKKHVQEQEAAGLAKEFLNA